MSPIENPTLEDFLRCAREEFHFLAVEFRFREQTLPKHRDVNQFQVRYRTATTLVEVEGTNWGYGVDVLLGPKRQPTFRSEDTFPLWPIVKLRRPDLYDTLGIGDQPAQLAAHAVALRECAQEVLRGDFSIRGEVRRLIEEVALSQRSELEEWRYHTAIEEANAAFRSKDYRRVVGVLVQHENRLTPAQRLKLEYARRQCS
ncbi:MAG TPA: hypothetical protein VLK82_11980 [Candidatus Tectomicrobia bacterium]|nr:hypothetical protein [Candidatus Tectomicrobia bacterium]